eukprot:COSAG06_NODE_530_length_14570_cov_23.269435_4_plen_99_part_00
MSSPSASTSRPDSTFAYVPISLANAFSISGTYQKRGDQSRFKSNHPIKGIVCFALVPSVSWQKGDRFSAKVLLSLSGMLPRAAAALLSRTSAAGRSLA